MAKTPTLDAFSQKLGYPFSDTALLQRALRHASLDVDDDNERLEFLGDRVLGLAIADELLRRYPQENEGALARRLAQLVSRKTCALIAKSWNLQKVLQADSGASGVSGAAMTENVLANGCEAVLGAIYLDGGLDKAAEIIIRHWQPYFSQQSDVPIDHKSALQEWTMKRGQDLPSYEIIDRQGPDHAPQFKVRVTTQQAASEASGKSRRLAEQLAAAACLKQLTDEESR